jgi:hypothetical protein
MDKKTKITALLLTFLFPQSSWRYLPYLFRLRVRPTRATQTRKEKEVSISITRRENPRHGSQPGAASPQAAVGSSTTSHILRVEMAYQRRGE